MSQVLVIRLSALGDVAMLIPVLYSVASHYPSDRFILLTKKPFIGIFENKPENVRIIPVFTQGKHKGIRGLFRLINEMAKENPDRIADMHNVLRSRQIRYFFRLKGEKIAVINKGRKEKKALTRFRNKELHPLETSIERYHRVFTGLGYDFPIDFKSIYAEKIPDYTPINSFAGKKENVWIGIAPFAKHPGKIIPHETMRKVISLLLVGDVRIFLFGGRDERIILEEWAHEDKRIQLPPDSFSFSEELLLMSRLDVMISMDSGNMHLASLVGIPVISAWGATHPFAGFYGYHQDPAWAVQIDLSCRPCSVYGNKPCFRKDYACLTRITPEMIAEKVHTLLQKKNDKKEE